MAWNDPTALKFDVSAISSMRSKLQETSTELSELSTTLLSEIEILKQSWKTPAVRYLLKNSTQVGLTK